MHAEDGASELDWTKTFMAKHDLSKAQEVRSAEHAANTEQIADSTETKETLASAEALNTDLRHREH